MTCSPEQTIKILESINLINYVTGQDTACCLQSCAGATTRQEEESTSTPQEGADDCAEPQACGASTAQHEDAVRQISCAAVQHGAEKSFQPRCIGRESGRFSMLSHNSVASQVQGCVHNDSDRHFSSGAAPFSARQYDTECRDSSRVSRCLGKQHICVLCLFAELLTDVLSELSDCDVGSAGDSYGCEPDC